jgi:hypothetical protein
MWFAAALSLLAGIDTNLVNQCVRKLFRELSFFKRIPGKLPKPFADRLRR